MARVCKSAIDEVNAEGARVALFRPITLKPWPYAACRTAMDHLVEGGRVLTVEMSMGQMVDDVRLAAEGSRPIDFHGTAGGVVPTPEEVVRKIRERLPAEGRHD